MVIASAALRVGDRDGPDAMTMRRIATELSCDPMAPYRYFANREALLDAVADLALASADLGAADAEWDERLVAIARGIRTAALRHPGITGHIASRPPLGENGRRLADSMFAALAQARFSPTDAVRTSQVLVVFVASTLAMAVHAGTKDKRWTQVSEALSELPGTPPGESLMIAGSDEQFDYGLRLLIAGIRAEAENRRHEP